MDFETNKQKGRAGIALAIAYFASNGYTVSIPLDDTQDYDLVVEKENRFQKVQCKATNAMTAYGSYTLSLRSCGGTKGTPYACVIEGSADLLFALCGDGTMYCIPINKLTAKNAINLRKTPSKFANKDAVDYSEYIVVM